MLWIDPEPGVDELRPRIFSGDLIVLTRLAAVAELVQHAREQVRELFGSEDPETIHQKLDSTEIAKRVGAWKPEFIHSERSKKLIRRVMEEAGCSDSDTYFDVPKPRVSIPEATDEPGAVFGFPWHRDVWYSAPPQQINWWMPIFPVLENNGISFDHTRFSRGVKNDSADFDYYRHNAVRGLVDPAERARAIVSPGAIGHGSELESIVIPPPGGILLFSGAQLHRSLPNTSARTRYSLDFRTVNVRDVESGAGAKLVDADCTGTAVRDFISLDGTRRIDEATVVSAFGEPPADAVLVFDPSA